MTLKLKAIGEQFFFFCYTKNAFSNSFNKKKLKFSKESAKKRLAGFPIRITLIFLVAKINFGFRQIKMKRKFF